MGVFRIRSQFIPILFAVAAFSLVWRLGVAGIPKPFEILIFLVFALVAVELATSTPARESLRELMPNIRFYRMFFLAFLGFTFLGLAATSAQFPSWRDYFDEVLLEYGRMLFVFLLFFLAAYVSYRYRSAARWTLGAIALSPALLFAAFVPKWQDFFTADGRLVGARNDPNYLATFLALGLLFAAVYFLFGRSPKKWLSVGYVALASLLFLWAYSRAAYLSITVTLLALAALYVLRHRSLQSAGLVVFLGAVFVVATSASFFVLPSDSQFLIYRRSIAPLFPSEELRVFTADLISKGDESVRTAVLRKIPRADTFDVSRGELWGNALRRTAGAPLGFGPAYHNWNPVVGAGRPHNLFFEALLTAGWGGFIIFLVFLGGVSKRAIALVRRGEAVGIALALGFFYLLINSMFLDMLTLRWLWLVMGFIVGYALVEKNGSSNRVGAPADLQRE